MLTLNKNIHPFDVNKKREKAHLDQSVWSIQSYKPQEDNASQLFEHLLAVANPNLNISVSAKPLEKNAESDGKPISAFIAQEQNRRQQKQQKQTSRASQTSHASQTARAQNHKTEQVATIEYRSAFLFRKSSF